MMTAEIRINGSMISHIYIRNISSEFSVDGMNLYKYEYYQPETGEVKTGEIKFKRDKGALTLVRDIINKMEAKNERG